MKAAAANKPVAETLLAAREVSVALNVWAASMVAARRIGGGKSEGAGDRKGGDKGEGKSGMGYDETAAVEYVAASATMVAEVWWR